MNARAPRSTQALSAFLFGKNTPEVILLSALTLLASGPACRQTTETTDISDTDKLVLGEVNDSAGFKVQVGPDISYPASIHPKGDSDWTTECQIDQEEVLTEAADRNCVVEVEEKDLFFGGSQLQYNVPSDMCAYFVVRPYWYYSYEAGDGPGNFYYYVDQNGDSGIDTGPADGTIDTANVTSHPKVTLSSGSPTCMYDYSSSDGPNCCSGEYEMKILTWNSDTSAYEPSLSTGDWGGSPGNCISGSAVDTQDKTDDGLPMPDVKLIEGTGVNDVYTIAAPQSKSRLSNLYAANADFGGGSGATEIDSAMFGSRFYSFECYDRGFEMQARIRVEIQEWNRAADYELSSAGSPDYGDDPDTEEAPPFEGEPINDFWDWHTFYREDGNDSTPYPKARD